MTGRVLPGWTRAQRQLGHMQLASYPPQTSPPPLLSSGEYTPRLPKHIHTHTHVHAHTLLPTASRCPTMTEASPSIGSPPRPERARQQLQGSLSHTHTHAQTLYPRQHEQSDAILNATIVTLLGPPNQRVNTHTYTHARRYGGVCVCVCPAAVSHLPLSRVEARRTTSRWRSGTCCPLLALSS